MQKQVFCALLDHVNYKPHVRGLCTLACTNGDCACRLSAVLTGQTRLASSTANSSTSVSPAGGAKARHMINGVTLKRVIHYIPYFLGECDMLLRPAGFT